jgi:hypothetical protein
LYSFLFINNNEEHSPKRFAAENVLQAPRRGQSLLAEATVTTLAVDGCALSDASLALTPSLHTILL